MFPSDGVSVIKRNLISYAAGTWRGGAGLFDTRGFRIGHPIDINRLHTPINAVIGHKLVSLTVTRESDGSALPELPDLDTLYTLSESDISITPT